MKKQLLRSLWLTCVRVALALVAIHASSNQAHAFPVTAPATVRMDAAASHTVNVKEFGAIGDEKTDDTSALQRALSGGRRTVLIPAGTYTIHSALLVDSETVIRADPEAVIRLASGAGHSVDVFLLRNRDEISGNHDIVVEGGIWDGNNAFNPRGSPQHMPCYTGVAFHFFNVRRLALRKLVMRNPETYAIRAARLTDFLIEDVGFDFSSVRENQDGVHLNGYCERGVIRNLQALSPYATNDDMVALNADDGAADTYVFQQGMIPGPIRNITVEHLRAPSVFSFVRLLSNQQPIENVRINNIVGGCRFYAINMDRWRFPAGGGKIRNVLLENITVHKAVDSFSRQSHAERRPLVMIQTAVENFSIHNFQRAEIEQPPAVTLIVNNEQTNRLHLDGLTATQEQALLAASSDIPPTAFTDSGSEDRRTLRLESKAAVTLPAGGFSKLELNTSADSSPQ